MSHDPIDSLIYLHESVGLSLDHLMEQIQEAYGWAEDDKNMAEYVSWAETLAEAIEGEFTKHYDGRKTYSTGVPIERSFRFPTSEPDGDGGECPVISQCAVILRPEGHPTEPPVSGGVWID